MVWPKELSFKEPLNLAMLANNNLPFLNPVRLNDSVSGARLNQKPDGTYCNVSTAPSDSREVASPSALSLSPLHLSLLMVSH